MKRYSIHKEGYKIILFTTLFVLLTNWALYEWAAHLETFRMIFGLLTLVLFVFVVMFFRIPLIRIFENEQCIYAPADGKIVAIEEVEETEYFKDKRLQVSIFMSPTNVHVNRNPISGEVQYTKYHPGNYLVAWHPKSSTKNERFTSVIKAEESEFEILVRQIAGKVARKISNYLDEGEKVIQGSEFGFIKFGSRVDIFLPVNTKVKIKLKDKVKAGRTILAEME